MAEVNTLYTPGEWLAKADWEGGLEEAILDYGLTEDSLDREAAPDLWEAIKVFREAALTPLMALQKIADKYDIY